ncbi:hypothetical protein [Sphingomonas sp. RS2018]
MASIGQVWDRTTEFLGDHLPRLMPVIVLALFVPACISGSVEPLRLTAGLPTRLGLFAVSTIVALLSLWGQLVIVSRAIDPALGQGAQRVATSRLLPAIGVFVLVVIGFAALFVPLALLLVLAGIDPAAARGGGAAMFSAMTPTLGWSIVAYTFVYLILILFVGARLMPLIGVVAAERRGLSAIPRAFRLSRGMTWKLVGVLLLYVVVTFVAVMAVNSVVGSIVKLALGGTGPVTAASVVTAIVSAVVTTALTALAAAFYGKLYVALAGEASLSQGSGVGDGVVA